MREDDEAMAEEISNLRRATEQLTAEVTWLKQMVTMILANGPKPAETQERTSAPIGLALAVPAVSGILIAIITTFGGRI